VKSKPAAIRTAKRNSQPGKRCRVTGYQSYSDIGRTSSTHVVGSKSKMLSWTFLLVGRCAGDFGVNPLRFFCHRQTRQHRHPRRRSLFRLLPRRPSRSTHSQAKCHSSHVCLPQQMEDQFVQSQPTVLRLMCVHTSLETIPR